MRINHIISTLLLGAFMVACQSNDDELVNDASDKILVSFGMGGEYPVSNNAATRASVTFDYYYIAVSAEPGTNGTITSGYAGYFTDLADASIGLSAGTYTFYISAYKQEGYTIDWSSVNNAFAAETFVEVTSATPYAPDFGDLKVDRYYGNTTQSITENTTISVDGKRFAYGIDINIEKPIEGKVILSAPSPALNYTVTDEALFDSNIFSFAGEDPDAIKSIDVSLSFYDASNNLLETRSKTVTIARNHKKTLKVKALDPRGAFDFTVEDGELTADEEEIFDSKYYYNGHEYSNLGLLVNGKIIMWAKCNVGAEHEYDYGDFFAWGEVEPKSQYSWQTYRWCNGYSTSLTKYCETSKNEIVDENTNLDPEDDAAHINWGGKWRMPTYEEIKVLLNLCSWTWVPASENNGFGGKDGYVVSNREDASEFIFLPAAGYINGEEHLNEGKNGDYWSSSLDDTNSSNACKIFFNERNKGIDRYGRQCGRSVRPVFTIEE